MSRNKYSTNVEPKLDQIEAWARNGVSEKDIAKNLNVAYSTFKTYKSSHPALSAVLARTRTYVDEVVVEGALLKAATGFVTTEVKVVYGYDDKGNWGKIREEQITKTVPPNPAAILMWLQSREREKWGKDAGDVVEEAAIVMLPERTVIDNEPEEPDGSGT